ncbi:MAG: heavy metal-binding domain-containing protein [Desulfatiglans sp.]|jgi:predicted RNA-binding Zn-ribbon protein involved in translation (DUF1610 family)|nr:heavy metal-binding domain-containing protein [Thermodesulfobacteriota bacterium]MEE4354545.1 heavy metal-binding domain-containing protein [Desulfatiglans sp.]
MDEIKRNRFVIWNIAMIGILAYVFLVSPVKASANKDDVYFTCPMESHADVAESKPGKCYKCGMKLVPRKMDGTKFTCPMESHADVISDKPGMCPKCGMRLVPKKMKK